MKNILTILFVLASVCVFGQTKEEAFKEMNEILKKLEGKAITMIDTGEAIKVVNQKISPFYLFVVGLNNVKVGVSAKEIPWESYASVTVVDADFNNMSLSVSFSEKFEFSMSLDGDVKTGEHNEMPFYIPKNKVDRFKELLKIVSGKQ